MKRESGNIWSYIILFLLTSLVGFPILVAIGYLVTKILKRPMTTYDNYGWRAFGLGMILFGILMLYVMIMLIFEGEAVLGSYFIGIIFIIAPLYLGKKFIVDWT